ncbi:GPI mannosyltransferase 2 [Entomortierella parvispora]|uniref:GPI mannosyltransferase 2 n=1 Tax=Entomortierella parvispora TaxID=205924 RepID=A0A9P3LU31_9FUNG|nr:GPI mannosyltransferase 2 [Entomortierella parvispora]
METKTHPRTTSDLQRQPQNRAWTVAYYALASRIVIWAIAVASHAFIQDYDSALELILPIDSAPQRLFKGILGVFLRWDSFYFVHQAEYGYVFEQAHAFFPLLPWLMRVVAGTVLAPLSFYLNDTQILVLAGVLVANASFIVATVQLYRLSSKLFGQEKFAFTSAILYAFSPSGIFMSAVYAESLFAALSFTGMVFAADKNYLLAAIAWSLSSTARSNGVLYAGFFIYDLVVQMDLQKPVLRNTFSVVKAMVFCLISWTGFITVQLYGYALYCSGEISSLDVRPWCSRSIPLLYSFVQEFYWNVGFLRYYEIKQIPNFAMAAPMIILSASGIYYYVKYDVHRALTLGRQSSQPETKDTAPFLSQKMFPYITLWAVLLLTNITTMHIQIITRAFSCMPPVYWFAAHQFDGRPSTPGSGWTWSVAIFFVMYSLIGIILFANFFPPA